MSIQAFSVCPGMTWQPGSAWSAPIQGDGASGGQEEASDAVEQGSPGLRRLTRRSFSRRRARTEQGTFQGDDPATPDIDEAYEADPVIDREN